MLSGTADAIAAQASAMGCHQHPTKQKYTKCERTRRQPSANPFGFPVREVANPAPENQPHSGAGRANRQANPSLPGTDLQGAPGCACSDSLGKEGVVHTPGRTGTTPNHSKKGETADRPAPLVAQTKSSARSTSDRAGNRPGPGAANAPTRRPPGAKAPSTEKNGNLRPAARAAKPARRNREPSTGSPPGERSRSPAHPLR